MPVILLVLLLLPSLAWARVDDPAAFIDYPLTIADHVAIVEMQTFAQPSRDPCFVGDRGFYYNPDKDGGTDPTFAYRTMYFLSRCYPGRYEVVDRINKSPVLLDGRVWPVGTRWIKYTDAATCLSDVFVFVSDPCLFRGYVLIGVGVESPPPPVDLGCPPRCFYGR